MCLITEGEFLMYVCMEGCMNNSKIHLTTLILFLAFIEFTTICNLLRFLA